MYVWIPRYTYTIFNGNNGMAEIQEIAVQFEEGTESKYNTVTCTDQITSYSNDETNTTSVSETCVDQNGTIVNGTSTYTHPAFKLGDKKLTGIWVGKFELSNIESCTSGYGSINDGCDLTNLGIQIKPNVKSWRGARVGTYYTVIQNLSTTKNDTHMIKNMEWGAVAYLKQSKYGTSTADMGINNNNESLTGCGAPGTGNAGTSTCNTYDSTNGKLASITGNVYGIYDMSGGAYEFVMGNMATSDSSPVVGKNSDATSGFIGNYYDGTAASGIYAAYTLNTKYTDMYSYDSSQTTTHGRGKLGDATKETLIIYGDRYGGWNSDKSNFLSYGFSWFLRGGFCTQTKNAGIFVFDSANGYADPANATRVVITRK